MSLKHRLTPRQLQVLDGRRRGKAVKEIAAELGISPHTVRHVLETIHRRLQVHSSREALYALTSAACRTCPKYQSW